MARFVITGTGTEIGKTVFAAGLCALTGGDYWKPVQTGTEDGTSDSKTVLHLSGARVHPPIYQFPQPLSPHRAAELAGETLDPAKLVPPTDVPLVAEGAGGVLVPITRDLLSADLFARWGMPVVLVCTTGLGTISHSLTAIEALRGRGCALHGLAFVGADNPDNIATIAAFSGARVLGRLPRLPRLDRASLLAAMTEHFDVEDFA
ncbi:dethiobiotin synthase [Paracoccus suum]|uniref:ATP-dependent dethiobiotin synthetase BioD n=1 Tax=Paracoccus suum TaxID=2259340 RepID=A0A344PHZ9_9RHOB|nr:dethiobiotin synthase [Paracoccus suum]AXC49004.1 dethiobiotin synthase [Paracoccus suum]